MPAFLSVRLDAEMQQLALSCLPMAYSLAKRFAAKTSIPLEDAQAAAVDALLHAAGKFDSSRGCKFSTLAHLSIRRRLMRAVDEWMRQQRRSVPFSCLDYADRCFDPPSSSSVDEVGAADNLLDARALLPRVKALLPKRLFRLAWSYYAEGLTLAEVGQKHGITRERVRQLVERALRRARRVLRGSMD